MNSKPHVCETDFCKLIIRCDRFQSVYFRSFVWLNRMNWVSIILTKEFAQPLAHQLTWKYMHIFVKISVFTVLMRYFLQNDGFKWQHTQKRYIVCHLKSVDSVEWMENITVQWLLAQIYFIKIEKYHAYQFTGPSQALTALWWTSFCFASWYRIRIFSSEKLKWTILCWCEIITEKC